MTYHSRGYDKISIFAGGAGRFDKGLLIAYPAGFDSVQQRDFGIIFFVKNRMMILAFVPAVV